MSLQAETYEALCAALYRMPFAELLGEKDLPSEENGGLARWGWFHIGTAPLDMRVAIVMPQGVEHVRVKIEWRNYHADAHNPLRCEQTVTISTYAATQADLFGPTEAAVLRVLEVYQDVLAETGVAGNIEALAEVEEDEDEDEDDPYE